MCPQIALLYGSHDPTSSANFSWLLAMVMLQWVLHIAPLTTPSPHQGLPGSISAGRSHSLQCEAEGSSPAADLEWWMDGQFLQRPREKYFEGRTISAVKVRHCCV